MKRAIKIVATLVALLIIGVLIAYLYIDAIAKGAIERGSTSALGVNTTVKTAALKIFDGRLVIGGLNVANPQGYQTKHFLNMKDGDVAVTLASLRRDIVEVPHLRLADIDLNLEKRDGKSNYQVILDNLKGSETQAEPGAPPPAEEEGQRYIVKELSVKNVMVHVDALGPMGKVNVPIDDIQLRNVGSETGKGVLLKDLAGVIVKAIFAAVVDKAGNLIPADIAGELQSGLAQLQSLEKIADIEKLGEIIKPIGDIKEIGEIKDLGDKAKEKVGETIGDLLGGKKDKP